MTKPVQFDSDFRVLPAPTVPSHNGESGLLLDAAMITYYDDLCRAMQRRGHVPTNVQDIVHDLYVRLRDNKTSLEGKTSLRAFLMRAAINLGLDRFRREKLEARLFAGSSLEAEQVAAQNSTDIDTILDIPQRLACLREAILELPLKQRRIFIASRIGNLSPDEIACRFNISRNMVDRHLRKALLHCLERLESLDP